MQTSPGMDLSDKEYNFKERLRSCFPDKKDYTLECSEKSASLKFLNYRISADVSSKHNMLMFLFKKGTEIIELQHKRLKEAIETKDQKKRQSFIDFSTREYKNKEKTLEVSSKVEFMKEDHDSYKRFKLSIMNDTSTAFFLPESCNKDRNLHEMEDADIKHDGIIKNVQKTKDDFNMQVYNVASYFDENEMEKNISNLQSGHKSLENNTFESTLQSTPHDSNKNSNSVDNFFEKGFDIIKQELLQIKDVNKVFVNAKKRKAFTDQNTSFVDFNTGNLSITDTNREFIEFAPNTSFENTTFLSSISEMPPAAYNPHTENATLNLNLLNQIENTENTENDLREGPKNIAVHSAAEQLAYTSESFYKFLKSLNSKEKNTPDSRNILFSNVLNPLIENMTTLDTSIIYDNSARADCLSPVNNSFTAKPDETNLIPDTDLLKKLMIEYKDTERGGIQIVRSFCSAYRMAPPEFEIVRENDVYRCTAMFLDINFVSSYEYDKLDAKDEACKKILDYIIRNWEDVFSKKTLFF